MTTDSINRTCSTCAHYNQANGADEPRCWNLTSIIEWPGTPKEVRREPQPEDHCPSHQTEAEDRVESSSIAANREGFLAAIEAHVAQNEERGPHCTRPRSPRRAKCARCSRNLAREVSPGHE